MGGDLLPTRGGRSRNHSDPPPSDPLASALRDAQDLAEDLQFLERELPGVKARLFAPYRELVDQVIALRRELFLLVRRKVDAAARRSLLAREGPDLLWHLATDLEERFGVSMRAYLPRMESPGEDEEEDDLADFDDFRQHSTPGGGADPSASRQTSRQAQARQAAAKGIYLRLARELHPDKSVDHLEKERRTLLMQQLTQAHGEGDLAALLGLLESHGSPRARSEALDPRLREACLAGLRERIDTLRQAHKRLRHQDTFLGVVDWLPVVRDGALLERLIRKAKAIPRQERDQLLQLRARWSSPSGLEDFLASTDQEDWPDLA